MSDPEMRHERDQRIVQPTKVIMNPVGEILDRVRRIETRLTAGLESLGAVVVTEKPKVITLETGGMGVSIPSTGVRLKDIMELVPAGVFGEVPIFHKGLFIAVIALNAAWNPERG
jgi:hypothetical protein